MDFNMKIYFEGGKFFLFMGLPLSNFVFILNYSLLGYVGKGLYVFFQKKKNIFNNIIKLNILIFYTPLLIVSLNLVRHLQIVEVCFILLFMSLIFQIEYILGNYLMLSSPITISYYSVTEKITYYDSTYKIAYLFGPLISFLAMIMYIFFLNLITLYILTIGNIVLVMFIKLIWRKYWERKLEAELQNIWQRQSIND